jgi:hypothetical protein
MKIQGQSINAKTCTYLQGWTNWFKIPGQSIGF